MRLLVDSLYLIIALLTAPLWLWRMARTGKIKTDWRARLGRAAPIQTDQRKRVLFHAVSVGEVNAIRLLVDRLAQADNPPHIIIATTTDTGYARATSLFADHHDVRRSPFDLSFSVDRFLNTINPHLCVLVELEVWPNFTAACEQRGIAICVINGRLSERSFQRYRYIRPFIAPSFRRLSFAAVATQQYGERFQAMSVPPGRVLLTGTMKWDTAELTDHVPGANALAREMGIDPTKPLVVAGSTAPGEHALFTEAVPPQAQLLAAPRKPEWFDHAAAAMPGCTRRSRHDHTSDTGRFLLDTIGELRQAYALADLVIIGRTFVNLGGSDMIEPIGLGKATIIGPTITNFKDIAQTLIAGDAVVQTDRVNLPKHIRALLNDPQRRRQLATNGRRVITANQSATTRHAELILSLLQQQSATAPANQPG